MKRFILLSVFMLLSISVFAQSRTEALLRYQQRRTAALNEYQENRRKAYADYMRKRWEAYTVESPEELPMRVEPVEPVVKQPKEEPANVEEPKPRHDEGAQESDIATKGEDVLPDGIKTEITIPLPEKIEEPKEVVTTPPARGDGMRFNFYGAECEVTFSSKHRFTLRSIDENSVADAWLLMDNEAFDTLIAESKAIKSELELNDWGYNLLVKQVAEEICGKETNESVVLRAYLLGESGYKMRLARGNDRLWLLVASQQQIYGRPYISVGGDKFYIFDTLPANMGLNVCNKSIDAEQALNFKMPVPPALPYVKGKCFARNNPRNGDVLNVVPNANLTAFYSQYPQCDWAIFAETSFSEMVYLQLLGPLKKMVAGKGERDALQSILTMIQYSFPYKNDAQQFGRERTFFADEMFAYMYSDCEDRSILFCRIVKDILNLDAVLLYYPEHIAAAVHLHESVEGDSVMVGNKRYMLCDPTYTGGDVGEVNHQFKGMKPTSIIKVE
jgi:hypothetical protein